MKSNILKDIIKYSKIVRGCKLKAEVLNSKKDFVLRVDQYFGTTRLQSILTVAIFDLNSEDTNPNLNDLAKYLKCNAIELFVYKKDFKTLENKSILGDQSFVSFMGRKSSKIYKISEHVKTKIGENKPFSPLPKQKLSDIEICEAVKEQLDKQRLGHMEAQAVESTYNGVIDYYSQSCLIHYLKKLKCSPADSLTYIYTIADNLDGNKETNLQDITGGVFLKKKNQINYENSICDNTCFLLKSNLLKLNDSSFFSSASVSLTEKARKDLAKIDIPIRLNEKSKRIELIEAKTIVKKPMFYNPETESVITEISQSLKPMKHKQMIKALKNEGFNTGICTLMYGAPGTGKTESVKQIAKITGRAIWNVDLSELKSMWFGKSQKLIKALFQDYKNLCLKEKHMPILLLNEADAILGKRMVNGNGAVSQTENAIQNIFLDCLENFEGILFATTNLEDSLDKAFERRFLYKVKFNCPNQKAQFYIWKSKIKGINNVFADTLAKRYNFSGGEIDNVARKLKMARVLNPKLNVEDTIYNICDAERIQNDKLVIGFKS